LLAEAFAGQIERGLLTRDLSGQRHDAATCHAAWSAAVGFVNRIPPFVWQDYGKRERIALPEPEPPTIASSNAAAAPATPVTGA